MNPFEIQEKQYDFPYHHIPHWGRSGEPQFSRVMTWGLEYLTYMDHIVHLISEIKPASLLDVGTGDGRLIEMIGERVPRKVGIDLSPRAIALARAMVPEEEFLVENVAHLKEEFDCVAAVEVLEHIPEAEVEPFVAALVDRVRPGGILLVSVPTLVTPVQKKHYRHYDKALLLTHLQVEKNGLLLLRESYLYRESAFSKFARTLLVNRHWVLTSRRLLQLFWRAHKRWSYRGDESNARHLVLVLKKLKKEF